VTAVQIVGINVLLDRPILGIQIWINVIKLSWLTRYLTHRVFFDDNFITKVVSEV
jgi:hypothetical protein